jgi:hypothetical protein
LQIINSKKEVMMKGLRRGKGITMFIGIIVTFGILMSANLAKAQFLATLLQGQSTGNQSTSTTDPFGLFTIGVTSIGNRSLSSSLTVNSNQTGLWTIFLIGTGGRTFADLAVGVSPFSGPSATVDVGQGVSFGLAIGNVLILDAVNPITTDNPLRFSLSVSGS